LSASMRQRIGSTIYADVFLPSLVVLICLPVVCSFDVVGWYVGTDESSWPLESLRWDVYSSIRCGYVQLDPNGTASCPTDAFFKKCLAAAQRHGKGVTLGPSGDDNALDWWSCYKNQTAPAVQARCDRYVDTLGEAVRSCGPGITGVEFDHEGTPTMLGKWGIVARREATAFSEFMDRMQKSMGGNYTVSEDVGVWGFDELTGRSDTYLLNLFTPWIDKDIFKANPNLFINTMSYHNPVSCNIHSWKLDGFVANQIWGIPKKQINLGIGYYSFNVSKGFHIPPKVTGEPTWHTLSQKCPNLAPDVCVCEGIPFASKQMNYDIGALIKAEGYRGAFPWAANYDSPLTNESHALWLGKGLGLVE